MSRPVPDPALADRLKTARQLIFPSAAAAADALSINPVTLRTHEAGTRGVSFRDLDRYARRYGVSIEWLITGKGDRWPKAELRYQSGELVNIMGVLEDGRWLEGTLADDDVPGWGPIPLESSDDFETTVYDDPRFPEEFIQAFKVRTRKTDGPYIDGTVVFGVPVYALGYRVGDHVVLARSVNGQTEWTVREALGEGRWKALISDGPDILHDRPQEEEDWVYHAVVTSYSSRREVPPLPIRERVEHERSETLWRRKHLKNT